MLELRIIDAMRAWPAGEPVTVRALAKAVGTPHLTLPDAIQSMRYRGVIEFDRLALTPVYAAANDPEPAETDVATSEKPTAAAPRAEMPRGKVVEDRALRVLEILREAAKAGAPCPKNRAMADAIGVEEAQLFHALTWLKDHGRIEVQVGVHRKQRRIRIIGEDITTDWTSPDQPRAMPVAAPVSDDRAEIIARVEETEQARATRVADLIRQEAEASAARRKLARSTGTVSNILPMPVQADGGLSLGAKIQMDMLKDSAVAVGSVLRQAWPTYWSLLGRLAQACGERPIPLILRLIREEAARKGLRRTRPGDPAWFAANSGGLDSDFDDLGFDGEVSIHG